MAARIYDEVQQRINLFCPPKLIQAAKEHAKKAGIPMSQLIRDALISYMEKENAPSNNKTDGS